jgi:iron complex outermembrane recepter protein
VWSYEAGVKSEFFDRRLRLNVTGFQVDISQLQIPSQLVTSQGITTFTTRNDASYRNRGAEVEVEAVPFKGALIYANLGFQNAGYRDLPAATLAQAARCRTLRAANSIGLGTCAAGIVTAQGDIARPVRAPAFTLAAGASYEAELPGTGISITPAINFNYASTFEAAAANLTFYRSTGGVVNPDGNGILLGGSRSFPTVFINASVTVATLDGAWRLLVDCTNCTDQFRTESGVAGYAYIGPPRSVNFRLRRRF